MDCHPTAEEVYRAVRRRLPRISLATVYKALDALAAAGLIAKLAGGEARRDTIAAGTDHYHLRDTRTGEVSDLPTPFDPDLLAKLDPRLVEQPDARRLSGLRLSAGSAGDVFGRRASRACGPSRFPW